MKKYPINKLQTYLIFQENMEFFKERYNPHPKDLPKIALKPLEKSLIVFPSWLTHSIEFNETNNGRISLSFNSILYINAK